MKISYLWVVSRPAQRAVPEAPSQAIFSNVKTCVWDEALPLVT
jgi:hypothetical protein